VFFDEAARYAERRSACRPRRCWLTPTAWTLPWFAKGPRDDRAAVRRELGQGRRLRLPERRLDAYKGPDARRPALAEVAATHPKARLVLLGRARPELPGGPEPGAPSGTAWSGSVVPAGHRGRRPGPVLPGGRRLPAAVVLGGLEPGPGRGRWRPVCRPSR
jgi:hypothetical protein